MSERAFSVDQFRALALERFRFLEANGFARVPTLEKSSPTYGTVVYLGNHAGFIFSLDVRDQCVDAEVVKVEAGQIRRNMDGGYSANLFTHVVRHAGYRGRSADSGRTSVADKSQTRIQKQIEGWAELIQGAGQTILRDQPDSLPI